MSNNTRWIRPLILSCMLAASVGWAKDNGDETRDMSLEQAREANETAAREAAEAVRTATRLDLDIRLIGPTSITIAGGQ